MLLDAGNSAARTRPLRPNPAEERDWRADAAGASSAVEAALLPTLDGKVAAPSDSSQKVVLTLALEKTLSVPGPCSTR